jgi:hypothetical protein
MGFRISFACLLIFSFSGYLFAQNKQPCKVTKNSGGKYKFVNGETSIVTAGKIFFLTIKLPQEKFNKEYLLKVARRIKETYCNEDKIIAQLWNSSDKRKFTDLVPLPVFPPWMKALYSVDRIENKEVIQFISSDKVIEEIKISK